LKMMIFSDVGWRSPFFCAFFSACWAFLFRVRFR
jgi:hypothetical protein